MDALAALAPAERGRIRLCYIDPPFNTGNDFDAYHDRAAHDVWLSCLEERVRAARALLCQGGFLVVHVNVVEQAYLKVLLDEIFGRETLVAQIAWQRAPDRTVLGQGHTLVADQVEYLLVYAHGAPEAGWPRPQRRAPLSPKTLATYGRVLHPSPEARLCDEFTDRAGEPVRIYAHAGHQLARAAADPTSDFAHRMRTTNQQPESTFQQALLGRMRETDVLYRAEYRQRRGKHEGARARFYLNGNVVLWLRDIAVLEAGRLVRVSDLNNFWTSDEIPATGIAGEGGVSLRRGKKPERLLERVIEAFSRPGERVLDFFAGSGTTGAVAERLGRSWILVEAGPAARELCEPRLVRAVSASGGGFAVAMV
jgi:adenine-specific DNA-methyltransferase